MPVPHHRLPHPSTCRRLAVVLLTFVGTTRADDTAPAAPEAVEVETFDGTLIRGTLVRYDGDRLTVTADSGDERTWPREELLSVRRVAPSPESPPEEPPPRSVVEIANGDRLVVRPLSADEDVLRVQWIAFESEPPIDVPLETVRGIVWRLSRDRTVRERTLASLRRGPGDEPGDRLVAENGDDVGGEFRGLDEDGVTLFVSGTESTVPTDRIRTLAFDPELVSLPDPPAAIVLVRLVDGSRLTATRLVVDADRASLVTLFGPRLDLPRSAIAALRFVGGRAIDLSDREPAVFEFTPFLSTEWPWQRDRSVTGAPLRIDGRTREKGLGVHSRSRLVYDLQPGDRSFRGTIGLDETANGGGSVTFHVVVDGREAYRSAVLRGGAAPLRIPPVDLQGSKRLELLVDFADQGDVLDRADWVDAVIVRE